MSLSILDWVSKAKYLSGYLCKLKVNRIIIRVITERKSDWLLCQMVVTGLICGIQVKFALRSRNKLSNWSEYPNLCDCCVRWLLLVYFTGYTSTFHWDPVIDQVTIWVSRSECLYPCVQSRVRMQGGHCIWVVIRVTLLSVQKQPCLTEIVAKHMFVIRCTNCAKKVMDWSLLAFSLRWYTFWKMLEGSQLRKYWLGLSRCVRECECNGWY